MFVVCVLIILLVFNSTLTRPLHRVQFSQTPQTKRQNAAECEESNSVLHQQYETESSRQSDTGRTDLVYDSDDTNGLCTSVDDPTPYNESYQTTTLIDFGRETDRASSFMNVTSCAPCAGEWGERYDVTDAPCDVNKGRYLSSEEETLSTCQQRARAISMPRLHDSMEVERHCDVMLVG